LAESVARAVMVAHSRVKKQQQNNENNDFKFRLNEVTDGEMRIF